MIETAASKSFANRCSHGAASPCENASTQRGGYNPLLWLNLVCLDAPLVAISWQFLFARSFHIVVPRAATAALFLTAWLIYLADRFGDNLSLGKSSPTSLRQKFCLRHRRTWLIAIAIVAIADLFVVATRLDAVAIFVGGIIGMAAVVYLLINRSRPSIWRVLPLKEISIGFIFAAGTMVGLLRGLTSAALPGWILFALLCALNCISIGVWERELDLLQGRISIATVHPGIDRSILWLLLAIIVLSIAFVRQTATELHVCIAASAILLAMVHVFRKKIEVDTRTALADLVLLTPLVLVTPQILGQA